MVTYSNGRLATEKVRDSINSNRTRQKNASPTATEPCLQVLPSCLSADCLPVQQRAGAARDLLGVPLGRERSRISWWDLIPEESQMFLVLLSAGGSKAEEADEERQSSRRAKDSLRIDTDVTLLLGIVPILKYLLLPGKKKREGKKKSLTSPQVEPFSTL